MPNFDLRGQGVLIGIIDTGIDYTNSIFQYADKTTRIAAIWDQTIISENPPQGREYGTEYTREQLNSALQSDNPFEIVPTRDENGHGTMIAGIAGGSEVPESNFYGIATNAEFVVVKLKPAKQYLMKFFMIPEDALGFQENDILLAIGYLLDAAQQLKQPISIGITLGTSQGAHDGRRLLSTYLSLAATRRGVAVTIAVGNEGNKRRHYHGIVNPVTGYDTVELNIGENESGFSMELWGESPSLFSIDILSPSGEYIPRIVTGLNENREISFVFEATVIMLDYQLVESQSGDQLILIRFMKPAPGIWRFNVYERGDLHMGFHIWLPMGDMISNQTYFIQPDNYTTLLGSATAEVPITVTAYNPNNNALYLNASRGYSRSNTIKPELAAPGVNYTAPNLVQGYSSYTGTGVAAAHTSGIVAMILEWGIVKNNQPTLDSLGIKKFLIRGARRSAGLTYPNRDWGYGILDVFNVFDILRSEAGGK